MTVKASAAGLIIGNEVLTAKVVEANGTHLIARLRERGIRLSSVTLVLDEVDAIVEGLQLLKRRARWIITSGGVGPTHDDVTVRAVALALGRRVVRMPEVEALVQQHYSGRATLEALRLADAPEGSTLWAQEGMKYPVLVCDDVFMLPGVPSLFKRQLEVVLARLPSERVELKALYLSASEADIAKALDAVALAMPHVAIGSYPNFELDADHRVKVTIEHAEPGPVAEALQRLEQTLPRGCIVRRE